MLGGMEVLAAPIPGAFVITPVVHGDDRGSFLEWFRHEATTEAIGHRFELAQANCSVSRRGVVRGIHYADVPPGQAKYVTCVQGGVRDVIVDLRVGSPGFGRWHAVRLDDVDHRAVYLPEGLGHGFAALTDQATVVYLCSTVHNPDAEHGVHPMDPDLGIDWGLETLVPPAEPVLSARDRAAPLLAAALEAGALPSAGAC
jgi:dTDP-4-dehydrorhamnose 3,5-epimerase